MVRMVTRFGRRSAQAPINPETGELYKYEMTYGSGRRPYAETLGELFGVLIVGYDDDVMIAQFVGE